MARFQLTRTAREDLKAIGRYTQRNWGRRQRDAYLTQLVGAGVKEAQIGRPEGGPLGSTGTELAWR